MLVVVPVMFCAIWYILCNLKLRNAWLLAPLFGVTVVSQQRRWKRSSNSDLASKREDVTCISLFIYICVLVRANLSRKCFLLVFIIYKAFLYIYEDFADRKRQRVCITEDLSRLKSKNLNPWECLIVISSLWKVYLYVFSCFQIFF